METLPFVFAGGGRFAAARQAPAGMLSATCPGLRDQVALDFSEPRGGADGYGALMVAPVESQTLPVHVLPATPVAETYATGPNWPLLG
jgi:hypothetical protein